MIDKVIYVNLDRRPDRKSWFLSEMDKMGVPPDIIERFPAKDWKDYDSFSSFTDAVKEDGILGELLQFDMDNPSLVGWDGHGLWSNACCLKKVIDSDQTTLIIQDDTALNIEWESLLSLLEPLDPHKHFDNWRNNTRIIQLDNDWQTK